MRPRRLVEARARAYRASVVRTANQAEALRRAVEERRAAGDSDDRIRSALISGGIPEDQLDRWI